MTGTQWTARARTAIDQGPPHGTNDASSSWSVADAAALAVLALAAVIGLLGITARLHDLDAVAFVAGTCLVVVAGWGVHTRSGRQDLASGRACDQPCPGRTGCPCRADRGEPHPGPDRLGR